MRFSLSTLAAWAPGLATLDDWRRWFAAPTPLDPGAQPALAWMAPMQRRRLAPLGRAALEVAQAARGDTREQPSVWVSRYGDLDLSVQLLDQLAAGAALSPTQFSHSVHNAIGAAFAIARGDHGDATALAAGAEGLGNAVVEAMGLIADGADEVLLVSYEAPLPEAFSGLAAAPAFPRAFACGLRREGAGGLAVELDWVDAPAEHADPDWPEDLAVLRFLLDPTRRLDVAAGGRTWRWSHGRGVD